MNNQSMKLTGAALLLGVSLVAPAQAKETVRLTCMNVGLPQVEALGDREGHGLQTWTYTCKQAGGVMDGAILTGSNVAELSGGDSVLLSGYGVARKAGATAAYIHSGGKSSPMMAGGKVTGSSGIGHGKFALATGSAAALAGKTYSYTYTLTNPRDYVVDVTYD